MYPNSRPGPPLTHPLGQRLGLCGAQANMQGEASMTPSLLIQATGNNGPKAGHKTAVCVFSNSQFNVFSNKTKGRNTWCFFSKQALVLKINQHGVGLCLWWFPLWTVERGGGGGPEAAGGRHCPLLLLLLHGARAPGRPRALAVLRPQGPWSYPGGHVTAGTRPDI